MDKEELSTTEELLKQQIEASIRHTHATRAVAIFLIWFTITALGLTLLFGIGLAFGGNVETIVMFVGAVGAIAGIWYTLSASLEELKKSRNPESSTGTRPGNSGS